MDQNITGADYKNREIAARIRELREISGISAEEMAERTGLTTAEYLRCEEGNQDLSIAFLYRCVLIFGRGYVRPFGRSQPQAAFLCFDPQG